MSRSFNDDFGDDEHPGGSLDLETGSQVGGGGAASSYGSDEGIDFDDELYGDSAGGALELDLPGGGPSHRPQPHLPSQQPPAPPAGGGGGPVVPDLAFNAHAPPASKPSLPAARPSGQMAAARPSGQMAAVRPSGQMAAVRPSGQMAAVRPSGQMAAVRPSGHVPAAGPSGGSLPPASEPSLPPASTSGYARAFVVEEPAKPTAAAVIAKYPPPPVQLLHAPRYAIRVVLRQLELRSDLESLRRRRSPDVPLYEAALRAYDTRTFRLGMAINCAALTVATVIFFLPVILRFMRAD